MAAAVLSPCRLNQQKNQATIPKMYSLKGVHWACLFGAVASLLTPASLAFAPSPSALVGNVPTLPKTIALPNELKASPHSVRLYSSSDDEDDFLASESNQGILGATGCVASITVLYSEYVLLNTGCGLHAGPFGLVGLAEGLSYLTVIAIAKLSLSEKQSTVSSSQVAWWI